MDNYCHVLHELCSKLHEYKYPFEKSDIPKNGIYIMFEKGEKAHGVKRIVRIGTHNKPDRLPERLHNHFYGNSKNSVFRKHIGAVVENPAETSISNYILKNISFVVIPLKIQQLLDFEKKIIGTVSLCKECKPSKNWLGLSSPENKIICSGLWQKDHVCKEPLNETEFRKLKTLIKISNKL